MAPAFSVLAQENRMIPGLVFFCNWQISLVDQAPLWDSDKSFNPHILVCHYPNHFISLGQSSFLIFDLFRLYAPRVRVRDSLNNHNTQSYSAPLSLLAAPHWKTSLFLKGSCLNYMHSFSEEIHIALFCTLLHHPTYCCPVWIQSMPIPWDNRKLGGMLLHHIIVS